MTNDARRPLRRDIVWGAGAVAVTCIAAAVVLQLWNADLRVPFSYSGDALQNQTIVKGVLDHGWYEHNPDLGWPFGLTLYDFPVVSGDNLQIVLMKIIGIFTSDSALVVNLFFLLTFPLVALSTFVCSRLLSLSRPAAAGVAVLFACAPFHFIRGETHLFITAYYAVPIGAYLALRSLRAEPVAWRSRRTVIPLVLACVIVGSAHVYYAAFTMALVLVAALVRLVAGPWRSALTAAALFALVGAVVVANHLPNAIYQAEHGRNAALERPASETEAYGLKIAQMVLPVEHHRLAPLSRLRQRYDQDGTQIEEGDPQALGTIATLGFIGLLVLALVALPFGRRRAGPGELVIGLAILTVAAVLIGSVGGFSSVFAYVFTGQLRAWGRIAIFVSFFSFIAVALAGERLARERSAREGVALLAAVVLLGLFDQTNSHSRPNYNAIAAAYHSDAAFVKAIEQRLPRGAAVFELPYEPFPEPQPQWIPDAGPYDMARGYIHSHTLRWSYGLMKGRQGNWQAAVVQLPPAELAQAVAAAGFSGIYLDGQGYADNGAHALAGLARETGVSPMRSHDQRLAFVDLRQYAGRLRAEHTAAQIAKLRHDVLKPVQYEFAGNVSKLQQDAQGRSYRLDGDAVLRMTNNDPSPRRVRVVFDAVPAYPAPARMQVQLPGGSRREFDLPVRGKKVELAFTLPPGASELGFRPDARPQLALPDTTQSFYVRILDPLVVDGAFGPFKPLSSDRRAASWLAPFGEL